MGGGGWEGGGHWGAGPLPVHDPAVVQEVHGVRNVQGPLQPGAKGGRRPGPQQLQQGAPALLRDDVGVGWVVGHAKHAEDVRVVHLPEYGHLRWWKAGIVLVEIRG